MDLWLEESGSEIFEKYDIPVATWAVFSGRGTNISLQDLEQRRRIIVAVSTIKAEFQCEVEKVWEMVTSLDKYSWRSDLDKIVVTVPEKEFEEYTKDGYVTKFRITAFEEYKKYEFDMENGNMQGHWTGIFSYKEGITVIEFTENVIAKRLIMKPFVGSYLRKQQTKYIEDLRNALR